jgi:anaerobic selenocysteine-containing dehydrogenase
MGRIVNSIVAQSAPQSSHAQGLEVVFRPDPAVYDGRFTNNGWLQEWPRPITQLTWDNAAIFSPKTAQEKGVVTTDLVEIAYRGYKMRAPVFIQPGHADGSVTVHLGYGRTRAGHVGTRIGFNAYGMRTSTALWQDYGLDVRKVGSDYCWSPSRTTTRSIPGGTPSRRRISRSTARIRM